MKKGKQKEENTHQIYNGPTKNITTTTTTTTSSASSTSTIQKTHQI
jgi:hypothetical protein